MAKKIIDLVEKDENVKKIVDQLLKDEEGGYKSKFDKMGFLIVQNRIYVAQPYKKNPTLSYEQAVLWVALLRAKNYYPFSPVLHTHNYDLSCKRLLSKEKEKKGAIHPMILKALHAEDYYRWDLHLMRGCTQMLLSKDAYEYRVSCASCGSVQSMAELQQKGKKTCCKARAMKGPLVLHWVSIGCRDEFHFAKWVLDIPIYELQSFIDGELIDLAEQLG